MKLLLLLGLLAVASGEAFFEDGDQDKFIAFKADHKKVYKEETEEKFRMKIFAGNLLYITQHNQKYQKGLVSFKLGVNKYADMLPHEFARIHNGYRRSNSSVNAEEKDNRKTFISPEGRTLPLFVDWRKKGAVTPIKDQGNCGSCWAFSTTGSLEGQHFINNGKLVSLSEQNLVDCSGSFGNNGCNGGLVDQSFQYIKNNSGIDTEDAYPYHAVDKECKFKKGKVGATVRGFVKIPEGKEIQLAKAVAFVGPISVAIDASPISFQFYQSGVYHEEKCSSKELNHAVLAVGYGYDFHGRPYWLVKNSWGTSWGEKGYVKMARYENNNCGIATDAIYPLV